MSKFGLKYDLDNKTRHDGKVWTFDECQELIDRFNGTYKVLYAWLNRRVEEARKTRIITSAFGRRRYIFGPFTSKNEREAKNTPIQVTASDLMLLGIAQLLEEGRIDRERALICASVHDSVVLEVRNDYVQELIPVLKHCLENPLLQGKKPSFITVPLLAEVEVGEKYGSMKEV